MKLRSLAIVGGVLAGLAVPGAALASYTTGPVNLRTGPSPGYGIITTAPPGAWVSVKFCSHGWCKVTFHGYTGWMSSGYITGGKPRYYQPRQYVYARPHKPYVYQPYRYYRPMPNYGIYLSFGPRRWR